MSLFSSPKASEPAPPPPPEYVNTRDEVGGTQSNYVTNPDGTKTLVTSALPLTPEQQAYKDKLKQIETDSLQWIEKLSTGYDRTQIPWLDGYLKDYETAQVTGADKALADRTTQEERALSRYGQADSSAGTEVRTARGNDYTDSRQQITRDMSAIEQGVRQNELGNATSLYSLASGRLDTQLGQMMGSLGQQQQFQMADGGLQQNRNLAIYNGALQTQQINAQSAASRMNNLASLASLATLAAGPLGFGVIGAKAGAAGLAAAAAGRK